jgi:cysteinyl-tRNA synthetase
MHNEMLQVEGKKMSKSLGNFFTVRDLLDQGVPGEVIRFVYLSTHYRKPMDWTAEKADQAKEKLRKWAHLVAGAPLGGVSEELVDALSDDLNTSLCLAVLEDLAEEERFADLKASALLLGFDLDDIADLDWANPYVFEGPDGRVRREGIDYQPSVGVISWGPIPDRVAEDALAVVLKWLALRRDGDYAAADQLRVAAEKCGLNLRAYRSSSGINGGTGHISDRPDPMALSELLK